MKKFLFLFVTILACTIGYSQQNIAFADGEYGRYNNFITVDNDNLNYDVEGTKYINEEYLPAKLSSYPDLTFNIKYNAFNDEMEVQSKNNKSYALNKLAKSVSVRFLHNNVTYSIFDYVNNDGVVETGYFQNISSGDKVLLLKKESIMFIKEKPSKTGYDEHRPPQYRRLKDKLFVKINNQNAIELPKSKKSILKLFPDKKSQISSFIKENKIKTSNESDLVKLVNYISSL